MFLQSIEQVQVRRIYIVSTRNLSTRWKGFDGKNSVLYRSFFSWTKGFSTYRRGSQSYRSQLQKDKDKTLPTYTLSKGRYGMRSGDDFMLVFYETSINRQDLGYTPVCQNVEKHYWSFRKDLRFRLTPGGQSKLKNRFHSFIS